jgi:periplasmic divalent cation tolerance protein
MTDPAETGVITTTVPSREIARQLADALLAERLAACVQILDIESHYTWKGERTADPEVMLLIKTRAALFERAISRIKALHPYETPEIVAQNFAAGFGPYLDWIAQSTA